MSAVVLVNGTIRSTKVLTKNADGSRFGRAVNILTEQGAELGETLEVTLFDPRPGEPAVRAESGDVVSWVVEVEAQRDRIRARYRGEAGSSPALHSSAGWPTLATEPESAPAA